MSIFDFLTSVFGVTCSVQGMQTNFCLNIALSFKPWYHSCICKYSSLKLSVAMAMGPILILYRCSMQRGCEIPACTCTARQSRITWNRNRRQLKPHSPSSHGADDASIPFLAEQTILSGRGSECLTIAPYRPYSAIIVDLPQVFSVLRHLARRFWNQTCSLETPTPLMIHLHNVAERSRKGTDKSFFEEFLCYCTVTRYSKHEALYAS